MIKFFRQIRHKLLAENRISKYLIYAIGEILLVVIGIMIALQVNNKNQERKAEEEIKTTLIQIQREISMDVFTSNYTYGEYIKKDSIRNLFMKNRMTYNGIKTDPTHVSDLAYDYIAMWRQTSGYEQFLQLIKGMPDQYKNIQEQLGWLHNLIGYQVDISHQRYRDTHVKIKDETYSQLEWYAKDEFTGDISEEQIQFYMHSPIFKSYVMRNGADAARLIRDVGWYRIQAMNIYYMIDEVLDGYGYKTPEYMRTTSLRDSTQAAALVGHYELISGPVDDSFGTSLDITSEGKQLYINSEGGIPTLLHYIQPHKLNFFIYQMSKVLKFNPENGELIMIGDNMEERRWQKVIKSDVQ